MSRDILAEQVDYYRRRAGEYDRTAYPDLESAKARIDRVVATLAPRGRILELACGTGMWTRALAEHSADVTALDASAEPIEIARARCPGHVRFALADLFTWRPSERYDVVFLGFFLSHVPTARLDDLLATVTSAVAPGGRLLFVDEHAGYPNKEEWSEQPEIAIRQTTDGAHHRMVKVYLDPDDMRTRLGRLGWTTSVELDRAWLIASASRTPA